MTFHVKFDINLAYILANSFQNFIKFYVRNIYEKGKFTNELSNLIFFRWNVVINFQKCWEIQQPELRRSFESRFTNSDARILVLDIRNMYDGNFGSKIAWKWTMHWTPRYTGEKIEFSERRGPYLIVKFRVVEPSEEMVDIDSFKNALLNFAKTFLLDEND